jgi:hypothetical protein
MQMPLSVRRFEMHPRFVLQNAILFKIKINLQLHFYEAEKISKVRNIPFVVESLTAALAVNNLIILRLSVTIYNSEKILSKQADEWTADLFLCMQKVNQLLLNLDGDKLPTRNN